MSLIKPVVAICEINSIPRFEEQCAELINLEYILMSVNCSFDSKDGCSVYQAIFVRPSAMPPNKMKR